MSYRLHRRYQGSLTGAAVGATIDRFLANATQTRRAPDPDRQVSAGIARRDATLQPTSWNAATRTIDVIWTTGARGVQTIFETGEMIDEELATGPENVRLEWLNSGAPVLNTHQYGDVAAQIGVVVPGSARMDKGQGVATLKLSDRPEVAGIVGDIVAGIIRYLSVGYRTHVFEVDPNASPRPLYRAIDWEPKEISFVSIPFDTGAQVRSAGEAQSTPCIIRTLNRQESPKVSNSWLNRFTRAFSGGAPASPAPNENSGDDVATPAYNRVASIAWLRDHVRSATETTNISSDLANDLVLELAQRQLSEGDARDAVMHIVTERQRHAVSGFGGIAGGSGVAMPAGNALIFGERTFDNPEFQAQAIEDALFARLSGKSPTDAARSFMGMSMVQMAGELLTRSGVQNVNRMSPSDILSAAAWNSGGQRSWMNQRSIGGAMHTTSDFPQLLLGAGNRFIMEVFQAAASPLKAISRQRSARDFRALTGLELSGFGTLPEVKEAGELTHGTFRERKETYRVRTFGKQFGLSRQAIINDDLGVFANPMLIMARSAAETEAQLLADIINNSPVMGDGIPLFDERHGNLAAAGALPSVETLDAARQGMRSQKGLDGSPLAPTPKYIVTGIENETLVEKLMTSLQTPSVSDANPFAGKLIPAVDPRLAPRPWYLFGDPNTAPTLEHAYLNGNEGPIVEQKDAWDSLGTSFRAYIDFGAGAVDWRGAYKNPGEPA